MMNKEFFGSTTIGERGQVVVPREAREKLGLKKGEKVLVFGIGDKGLFLTKLSSLKKMSKELERRHDEVKKILKRS